MNKNNNTLKQDNIIANVVDILKFLGYKNEELNVDEFEVLFKNLIDIYNIKYKTCDQTITSAIKETFQLKYKFIHVVPTEDNIEVENICEEESLIAPNDMNNVIDTYKDNKPNDKAKTLQPAIINNYLTVEQRDEEYEELIIQLESNIPETAKEYGLTKHYNYIRDLPQPVQKSQEWFDMRNGKITASDGGMVLNENKHEKPYKIILKKLDKVPFVSNEFCYHGKKYEAIAAIRAWKMGVKA